MTIGKKKRSRRACGPAPAVQDSLGIMLLGFVAMGIARGGRPRRPDATVAELLAARSLGEQVGKSFPNLLNLTNNAVQGA